MAGVAFVQVGWIASLVNSSYEVCRAWMDMHGFGCRSGMDGCTPLRPLSYKYVGLVVNVLA